MVSEILANIGSGNSLLPDGTKPLPETMLCSSSMGYVAFTWEQFPRKYSWYQTVWWVWKLYFQNYCSLPGTNELKHVLKMTCILWRYGSCRTTLPNGLQIALYFILVWNIGWTFSSDEVINSINIYYKFYRLLDQFASHLITGTDNVHFHDI